MGLVTQFSLFLRLTFWELSWDVMEPIAYFVTLGTGIGMYIYFLATHQDFAYQNWLQRMVSNYKVAAANPVRETLRADTLQPETLDITTVSQEILQHVVAHGCSKPMIHKLRVPSLRGCEKKEVTHPAGLSSPKLILL